jgi:hypothetical protein
MMAMKCTTHDDTKAFGPLENFNVVQPLLRIPCRRVYELEERKSSRNTAFVHLGHDEKTLERQ